MKYTIVCPIKIEHVGNNGWTIFRDASLHSYAKYLNTSDVESFIIVCPNSDMTTIRIECEKFTNIPFVFFSDEEVLDKKCENVRGWYKQQLIKLLISKFIKTYHYMVVDSDMYITRPLNASDLFYDNRIKYTSEPWQTLNNSDYSTNSKWWINSCKILRLSEEHLYNEKYLMGVTPQVFLTMRVNQLINHLESLYGERWQEIICDMCFTEFTLYWLFMCINNYEKNEYTHEGEQLWKHDKHTNILEQMNEEESLTVVQKSFEESSTIFSVIQGYLNVSFVNKLCDKICENINKTQDNEYDAVFVIGSMVTPAVIKKFSPEERYLQTLHTFKTIREKVPNSYIVLIEGSSITLEQKENFSNDVDHLILCSEDEDVRRYVYDIRNIGIGECKLLEIGMKFILKQKIKAKMCIKIGARYYLNDNFILSNYDPFRYNFRHHFDDFVKQDVYTTGLFTVPMKNILEFIQTLQIMMETIDYDSMVERLYYNLLSREQVNDIEILGLGGQLNYNGKLIDE
jgi:hypothetical protein